MQFINCASVRFSVMRKTVLPQMKTIPLRAVQFLLIPCVFFQLLYFRVFVMSFLVAKSRISHISRIILLDLHFFFWFFRSSSLALFVVHLLWFFCHVGLNVSLPSFTLTTTTKNSWIQQP